MGTILCGVMGQGPDRDPTELGFLTSRSPGLILMLG